MGLERAHAGAIPQLVWAARRDAARMPAFRTQPRQRNPELLIETKLVRNDAVILFAFCAFKNLFRNLMSSICYRIGYIAPSDRRLAVRAARSIFLFESLCER